MKKAAKIIVLILCAAVLLCGSLRSFADAATVSARVSASSNVTVGTTITVTVSFSAADIWGVEAYLSYNSSVLRFVSCADGNVVSNGNIMLILDSDGASTVRTTIKFTVQKPGSCALKITSSKIYDGGFTQIGAPTAGTTITAAAAAPVDTTPAGLKTAQKVMFGEKELYMWVDIDEVSLPAGFVKSAATYGDKQIEAARSDKQDLTLVYTTDAKGDNGRFYILEESQLYEYIQLSPSAKTYAVVRNPEVEPPTGYVQTTLTLNGSEVTAWKSGTGRNPEVFLLYLTDKNGDSMFFVYNTADDTYQRYADLHEPEPEIEDDGKETFGELLLRIFKDEYLCYVVVSLVVAICLTLLAVCVCADALHRSRGEETPDDEPAVTFTVWDTAEVGVFGEVSEPAPDSVKSADSVPLLTKENRGLFGSRKAAPTEDAAAASADGAKPDAEKQPNAENKDGETPEKEKNESDGEKAAEKAAEPKADEYVPAHGKQKRGLFGRKEKTVEQQKPAEPDGQGQPAAAEKRSDARRRMRAEKQAAKLKAKQEAAEQKKKEQAEKEAAEQKKKEQAEKEAAEQKKKEQAEKEAAELKKKEQAEKEAAEQEKKERAEKEAAELKKKEQAEKEAAEQKKKEQAEKEAAEQKKKEQAEKEAAELKKKEQAEKEAAELKKKEQAENRKAEKAEADADRKNTDEKPIITVKSDNKPEPEPKKKERNILLDNGETAYEYRAPYSVSDTAKFLFNSDIVLPEENSPEVIAQLPVYEEKVTQESRLTSILDRYRSKKDKEK